jgi:hypothetical protein
MASIYEQRRDADGFLYVLYSGENSFGAAELDALELDALFEGADLDALWAEARAEA